MSPSLMFGGRARDYSSATGFDKERPYPQKLDQTGNIFRDKHSSLLKTLINYGRKKVLQHWFLECMSASLMFVGKARNYSSVIGLDQERLFALITDIRLDWKNLPETNALVYKKCW